MRAIITKSLYKNGGVTMWIDGSFPIIEIKNEDLKSLIREILKFWPKNIEFTGKQFGISDTYTCGSVVEMKLFADKCYDNHDFGKNDEISGIVFDFVGKAIKSSSVFLCRLDQNDLDIDIIMTDIMARDDISVLD